MVLVFVTPKREGVSHLPHCQDEMNKNDSLQIWNDIDSEGKNSTRITTRLDFSKNCASPYLERNTGQSNSSFHGPYKRSTDFQNRTRNKGQRLQLLAVGTSFRLSICTSCTIIIVYLSDSYTQSIIPSHVFPCIPLYSLVFPCIPLYSLVFPCIPLHSLAFPCIPLQFPLS